jgi:hypothetical protein
MSRIDPLAAPSRHDRYLSKALTGIDVKRTFWNWRSGGGLRGTSAPD